MAKRKLGKNTLPLLAITALFLSVALVNYDKSLVSNSNSTQSVLSESDENKEDEKKEEKVEEKKEVRNEERKQEEKKSGETIRIEDKRTRVKIEVKNRVSNRNEIKIEDDDIDEVEIDDENELDDETETEDEDETESEFEEESEVASPDGSVNRFKLKIKTRTTAGKTIIETASGEVEVENDPEDTVNDLVENGLIDNPTTIEVKENEREKVEFEIQGTDSKKFLGIFEVVIPKTITVSSETGEVVSTNQNVWSRIISLLSI